MPRKISFTDRLTEFMATASEAELQSAASQVALALRLKYPHAAPKKRTRRVAATPLDQASVWISSSENA